MFGFEFMRSVSPFLRIPEPSALHEKSGSSSLLLFDQPVQPPSRRPEGGTVFVTGRCEGERLVITIRNPVAPDGSRPGHGMALNNIRSRLALTYRSLASLLTHEDGENYYAVLTLPHAQAADR